MTVDHPATGPVLLLVEGAPDERRRLAAGLVADRFRVHACGDAREAAGSLSRVRPQIAVIDLDLPDSDGLSLLRALRRGTPEPTWDAGMPVMAISSATHTHHVVRAIEQGADDHLSRPYPYPELLARLRGMLRRCNGATVADELCVGPLVVDRRSRSARLHGRPVGLSAKEFALLDALARDPRRVVTKQELLRDVWGYMSAGRTRTVDSHASRLRRKLEACGAGQRFVANVWGVGYRLLPEGV